MYHTQEIDDKNTWDGLVLKYGGNAPFQLWRFYETASQLGTVAKNILITKNSLPILLAQIRKYDANENITLHIIQGPIVIGEKYEEVLSFLISELAKIKNFAKGSVSLLIEPRWRYDAQLEKILLDIGFLKFQGKLLPNPDEQTIVLDLSDDAEKLLARLNRNMRRDIKKAEANQVYITQAESKNDFEIFYQLLLNTSKQKRFIIPPRQWIYHIYQSNNTPCSKLFLANFNGTVIASLFVIYSTDTAYSLFAAS